MRILFCADTNIQNKVKIDPEIIKLIQEKVDFSVCNLEGFLVEGEADPNSMSISYKYFKDFAEKMKIKYVSLANNHINDDGNKGRTRTIKLLDKLGIGHFGTKSTPYIIINEKIALLGSVWKITGGKQNELNTFRFNLNKQLNYIKELSRKYKVVCFPHWGVDLEILPHPWQRKVAEKIINSGADLIYGSHSHLIHPIETIKSTEVVYCGATFVMPKNNITYYLPKETNNGLQIIINLFTSDIDFIRTTFNTTKRCLTFQNSTELNITNWEEGRYSNYFKQKRKKKNLPIYKQNTFFNSFKSLYPLFLSYVFRYKVTKELWKKLKKFRKKREG